MSAVNAFERKTAFVTGAASGIGLALSQALIARGANVMMADIDGEKLAAAAASLRSHDRLGTTICNVADYGSLTEAAKATVYRFGKVHLLFNNAGVSLAGQNGSISVKDWRWIVDINLMGVVHGIEAFLPLIQSHGEGGHIVNTASMAGHYASAYMSPYNATKFAVVGYSEGLRLELENKKIGVSVLCPTWVRSKIYNAHGGAPSLAGSDVDFTQSPVYQASKHIIDNGMRAEDFANLTLGAIVQNRFYVFNDKDARVAIDARRDHILSDYDACLADIDAQKGK
jgi:NADP-dependent 3-hydroxy acid dehydrogenase YdfG